MREVGCDWKFHRREMNFSFGVVVDGFADELEHLMNSLVLALTFFTSLQKKVIFILIS